MVNTFRRLMLVISKFVLVIQIILVTGCYCEGGSNGKRSEVGVDNGRKVCGAGRYPSFDGYCRGNIGCSERGWIVDGGCYCSVCDDERCVEIRCVSEVSDIEELVSDIKDVYTDVVVGEIEEDGGVEITDVMDVLDGGDVGDGGVIDVRIPEEEYICKDPGDSDGVEFEGNLDKGIAYIGVTYEYAVIRGDYIIWLAPDESDIYYLSLKDRKVRRVPNCDRVRSISWMIAEVDRIYWTNFIINNKGKGVEVMFYYNIPRKEIRILSPMDLVGTPYPYGKTLFFEVWKDTRYFLYYKDVDSYDYRVIEYSVLDKIMNLGIGGIGGYYHGLWENLLLDSTRQSIITVNLDTLEKKEVFVYDTDDDIILEPWRYCYGPVLVFDKGISREKGPYGHYTTDVFYIDLRDYRVVRVTDDEVFQYGVTSYYDDKYKLLVYYENYDPRLSGYGGGYLVVYDIETGARRRIPEIEGDIMAVSMYGARLLVGLDRGFYVYRFSLVDLEKLGIVKDGHVVPE